MPTAHPSQRLAAWFAAGQAELVARYGSRLKADQQRAMRAILACRTGVLGCLDWCCPDCAEHRETQRSCGNRSCPQCQNHTTTQWLDRQREKLLPVDYFMVTFTLPAELRPLAQAPATGGVFGPLPCSLRHPQRLWCAQAQRRAWPVCGVTHPQPPPRPASACTHRRARRRYRCPAQAMAPNERPLSVQRLRACPGVPRKTAAPAERGRLVHSGRTANRSGSSIAATSAVGSPPWNTCRAISIAASSASRILSAMMKPAAS